MTLLASMANTRATTHPTREAITAMPIVLSQASITAGRARNPQFGRKNSTSTSLPLVRSVNSGMRVKSIPRPAQTVMTRLTSRPIVSAELGAGLRGRDAARGATTCSVTELIPGFPPACR